MEYELLDTGIFNENRYFDVFVEYAKASPEDILIKITAINRGPESASIRLLPTLWFRNNWAEWIHKEEQKPLITQAEGISGTSAVVAVHPTLGNYNFYCEA